MSADQHSAAVRRVELVAGQGDEVDVERRDVDGPMGSELRSIDDDPGAVTVRDGGELGDRQHFAGHVARPRDRHEHGAAVQPAERCVEQIR